MKNIVRLAFPFLACISIISKDASAQLVGISVELVADHDTTGIASLAGMKTYRVYADLTNPTDKVSAVYGDETAPLSLTSSEGFFNSTSGDDLAQGVNALYFPAYPDREYDSWLTIGYAPGDPILGNVSSVGMVEPFNIFNSGGDLVLASAFGGSWFVTSDPNAIAGDDLKVLLAQLTTSGTFEGMFNLQIFLEGILSNEQQAEGISFVVQPGCTDTSACNYSPASVADDGSCVYPIVSWLDCDGNCIDDADGDGVCNGFEIIGCLDFEACNFDSLATSPGLCEFPSETWLDCSGNCLNDSDGDGVCDEFEVFGCTNPAALNFNPEATAYDGTCEMEPAEIQISGGSSGYGMTIAEHAVHTTGALAGMTTYRFYIDMVNETDFLTSIHGNEDNPFYLLTSDGFYNDGFASGSTAGGVQLEFFGFFPDMEFDSWVTIGIQEAPNPPYTSIATIESPTQPWTDSFNANSSASGSNVIMDDFHGGAWWVTNVAPNGLPDPTTNRTLFLQLTTAGIISGTINARVLPQGIGADQLQLTFHFDSAPAGCLDPIACNYDSNASTESGDCEYPTATTDCEGNCLEDLNGNGICDPDEVYGCLYQFACNFNPEANVEDGTCEFYCPGCTNLDACNFDGDAIQDDGSCSFPEEYFGVDYLNCSGVCLNDNDGDGVCDEEEVAGCMDSAACNYNPDATDQLIECEYPLPARDCNGECFNDADLDGVCDELDDCPLDPENDADGDGVCADDEIWGCEDEAACNFQLAATQDDGSCTYPVESYLDCSGECLNDEDDDGICNELEIQGCQNPTACNYNSNATDPGTCEFSSCSGCVYPFACNYDPDALVSDGSCEFGTCPGCTDPIACNFNPTVTEDDGSCVYQDACGNCEASSPPYLDCDGNCLNDDDADGICNELEIPGCQDANACNFLPEATDSDGSCSFAEVGYDCSGECLNDADGDEVCDEFEVVGCMNALACNFDESATDDSGDCAYASGCDVCSGETDGTGVVIDLDADDDGVCDADEVEGCTDPEACNYDATPTTDSNESLCVYAAGCDACSGEQDGSGTVVNGDSDGDGVCDADELPGCMNSAACNYAEWATDEDGTCIYPVGCDVCSGATDGSGFVLNGDTNGNGICDSDEVMGCTYIAACNYDAAATSDDGSCEFPELGFNCEGDCMADADANGICDSDDLADLMGQIDSGALCSSGTVWNVNLQQCVASYCQADLNGDAWIGVADLLLMLGSFESGCDTWGCTDAAALNFDGLADYDDGSCVY